MSVFSSRTTGYKAGVYLLFFACVACLAGYAAPYWVYAELEETSSSGFLGSWSTTYDEGMWMMCTTVKIQDAAGVTDCAFYGLIGLPAWFQAVRVLQSVGVIGTIASCIYALVKNCCSSFPGPRSRALEIFTGVTGVISFAGCMVYVGLRKDTDAATDGLYLSLLYTSVDFSWAFYLAAIGSALHVLAAVLVGVGNRNVEGAADGARLIMTDVPAGPPSPYAQPHAHSPLPVAGYPGPSYPSYPNFQGQRY